LTESLQAKKGRIKKRATACEQLNEFDQTMLAKDESKKNIMQSSFRPSSELLSTLAARIDQVKLTMLLYLLYKQV